METVCTFFSYYRKIRVIKVRFGAKVRFRARVRVRVRAWGRIRARVRVRAGVRGRLQKKLQLSFCFVSVFWRLVFKLLRVTDVTN